MRSLPGFVLFLLLLLACIDPLPLRTDGSEPALVVDGLITDQPGSHTVRLSMSRLPTANEQLPELVEQATVLLTDDLQRTFEFHEDEPGVYRSDGNFRGEIGRVYALQIFLKDGTEYRSTDEKLLPAGTVDSLYAVYNENAINQTDPSLPQDAITFFVNGTSDPSNVDGLLRWRSVAIHEILTFPERRTKMKGDLRVPDPLPCSGYVNFGDELKLVDTCSCCNCWVYEYPRNAVVSPTRFAEHNEYRSVTLAEIPVDSWRFFRKFYFEVEQLSLSESVFEFWKRVNAQQQGTGSLFQPNAIRIKGNIQCTTDPARPVFGVFSASAISRKSLFITRSDLPTRVAEPQEVLFDCRYYVKNADNMKPPFW